MVWYDWVLIAPIVLGVILGYRMGLIKNVLYIVLVAITMIIGGLLSQMIVDAIGLELESDGLVTVIGYGILLIAGFLGVQLFSGVVQMIISKITFGIGDKVNAVGGLASGLVLGFLVTTIIVNITARWTYTPDEEEDGRLEISEEAISKMFENSIKDTSREAADKILRESLMVGVVIDVKNLLGGQFLGIIPGEFSDTLDIADERRATD
ncbi:MAG: CvpA family protein [SAR202 cluster bacterium]|nr:CvpA family protein [SAR202 cluster bacterium]MQF92944.1 CvpA family protein [SAR202 cluster bacterium]|tara:strand:+ start:312 stop:938 length:627 start_codon:yes stop_codon:yes gene_type:complete